MPHFVVGFDGTGKQFCVKNIPADFIDWDLFRIFYKYGTIHNVRIPSKQAQSKNRYGFVIMEDCNGADEVRCHLKHGKYLITKSGLQLSVSSVRSGNKWFPDDDEEYSSKKNRTPPKGRKKCLTERPTVFKVNEPFCGVKCFPQDLPLRESIKVRVVDSPHPCKCADDGFIFHVIPTDQKLGEEYDFLQQEMNKFCVENPNVVDRPTLGQYVLFYRNNAAHRAFCNSDLTVYLVDTGEIVPMELSQLWSITSAFTLLPSLVVPCAISEVSWTASGVAFNSFRDVLKEWSALYASCLTATATGYSGLLNMIHLEAVSNGVVENFADFIGTKGVYMRPSPTHYCYSRELLIRIRSSTKVKDKAST